MVYAEIGEVAARVRIQRFCLSLTVNTRKTKQNQNQSVPHLHICGYNCPIDAISVDAHYWSGPSRCNGRKS